MSEVMDDQHTGVICCACMFTYACPPNRPWLCRRVTEAGGSIMDSTITGGPNPMDKVKVTPRRDRAEEMNRRQIDIRKENAGDDSIYQPSSGREQLEGIEQVIKKGARKRYLDQKIEEAGG